MQGTAAHSGVNHQQGISAIKEMAQQILYIESLTDYDRGVTLNVGKVAGGTAENTIPDYCEATIDLRIENPTLAEEIEKKLMTLNYKKDGIQVKVQGGINRPPFSVTEEGEKLFEIAKKHAKEIGFELVGMHTGGGSDGSFLAEKVPTLDGLGVDGIGPHTLNEHLFISSLVPRMMLLKKLFENLD